MITALALFLISAAPVDVTAEAALRDTILNQERALLSSQHETGRVQANLTRLVEERRQVGIRLRELELEERRLQSAVDELQSKELVLEADLKVRRRRVGDRMALLVRQSSSGPLEMLLTANGPAEFVYRYHALRAITAAEKKLMTDLRESQASLDANRILLSAQLAAVSDVKGRAQAEWLRLSALETLQREQVAVLQDEADERREWLKVMLERAEALGVMIQQLQSNPHASSKPTYMEPVTGERVAVFGQQDPLVGSLLPSDGWRYRAPEGEAVRSVAAGTVSYADWFQGYGNLVVIDHGGGISSLYAHLAKISVAPGGLVEPGQVVGEAGSTGSVSEAGLYFEVRRLGHPVDPAGWLKPRPVRVGRKGR
jgi:septal ring factor EnvC (AmiA/AmiB activator)